MPLQKQHVSIPITLGLDETQDTRLSLSLNKMENCEYVKVGAIDKRFGTSGLSTAATVPLMDTVAMSGHPCSMFQYKDTVSAVSGGKIYSYSSAESKWSYSSSFPNAVATSDVVASIVRPSPNVRYSHAYGSGLYVIAYVNRSLDLVIRVIDVNGATVNTLYTGLAPPTDVRVAYLSSTSFAIIVAESTLGNIKGLIYNPTANTFSAFSTLTSSAYQNYPTQNIIFDFIVLDTMYLLSFVYKTGANYGVKVATFNASLSSITSATALVDTDTHVPVSISSCGNIDGSNSSWLTYQMGLNVKLAKLNSSLAETITAATIRTILATSQIYNLGICYIGTISAVQSAFVIGVDNVSHIVFGTKCNSTGVISFVDTNFIDASPEAITNDEIACMNIASRPFFVSSTSKIYCVLRFYDGTDTTQIQSGIFLCEMVTDNTPQYNNAMVPICSISPNTSFTSALELNNGINTNINIINYSSGEYNFLYNTYNDSNIAIFDTAIRSANIFQCKISFNDSEKSTVLNSYGSLFVSSSGVPCVYDGVNLNELSFSFSPYSIGITKLAGGTLTAGTRSYLFIMMYSDLAGNIQHSSPSLACQVTNVLNDKNQVSCYYSTLTKRKNTGVTSGLPSMLLYRTIAGGSTYYLINADAVDVSTAFYRFVDNNADADITNNEQPYTSGGVLPNTPPPTCKFLLFHNNRMWMSGTDDDSLWFSKNINNNAELAFNNGFTVPPFEGGRVIGIATLDSRLIILKKESIYYIDGDGPDDLGNQSTLSPPTMISSSDGCIEQRSIVSTSDGVYFQSRRGIVLLNRSLQTAFIGNPVQDELVGREITSAVLDTKSFKVLFSTSDGTSGPVLAFDYRTKTWSTRMYQDPVSASGAQRAVRAACMWNGAYTFITEGRQVYTVNPATYLDGGTQWVTMTVETGNIVADTMSSSYGTVGAGASQGFQRVWRVGLLGRRDSASGFSLAIATDYSTSYQQTATFSEASVTAMALEQVMIHVVRQKSEAIRIKYVDSAPVSLGTGKGSSITGIALELGVKPTLTRNLPATQKG